MREEFVHDFEIALNDTKIAFGEFVPVAHGDFRKELAWGGVTDGGVVLERRHRFVDFTVFRSDPADAQTCESVGLGGDAQ